MTEEKFLKAIDEARDEIIKMVKENGGFMRIEQGDEPIRTVLVNMEDGNDWHRDMWHEAYVHALMIDDLGLLWYFTDPVSVLTYTKWTDEEIRSCPTDSADSGWYCLDWDCSAAYAHNVERIFHYITNEDY